MSCAPEFRSLKGSSPTCPSHAALRYLSSMTVPCPVLGRLTRRSTCSRIAASGRTSSRIWSAGSMRCISQARWCWKSASEWKTGRLSFSLSRTSSSRTLPAICIADLQVVGTPSTRRAIPQLLKPLTGRVELLIREELLELRAKDDGLDGEVQAPFLPQGGEAGRDGRAGQQSAGSVQRAVLGQHAQVDRRVVPGLPERPRVDVAHRLVEGPSNGEIVSGWICHGRPPLGEVPQHALAGTPSHHSNPRGTAPRRRPARSRPRAGGGVPPPTCCAAPA